VKKALKNSTVNFALGTVSIIFLVGIALTFTIDSYFQEKISQARVDRYDLTTNANLFMSGSANLTNEVRAYAATCKEEHYENYWDEVNTVQSRERGLAAMQEIGITDEEQAMIDEMSSISNDLVPLEEQAMQLAKAGNSQAAVDYVYGEEYSASIAKINQLKEDFLVQINERTLKGVSRQEKACARMNRTVWVVICITIAVQVIHSFYTRRKIIRPIIMIEREMMQIATGNLHSEFTLVPDTSEIGMLVGAIHRTKEALIQYVGDISEKLSQMASGNMNQSIDIEYIGDFRPIQDAMTTILNSLNHILGEILNSSELVAGEADQVASGAQNLAEGATMQASSVEELSATINDISGRMAKIAQNAQSARNISNDASEVVNLCSEKMQELVDAMRQISDTSSEISKIIDTIDGIAFQTNILALNAAVESARVGEVGKGFAVVAGEVSSLANKSQSAAKSTADLISNALEAIQNGTKIVDETARTLMQVVDGAKQSTDYVDKIADDSKEQSGALQQLTVGVNQISDVVQNTSATSQESAAASAELNEQAANMQQLMNSFVLRQRG